LFRTYVLRMIFLLESERAICVAKLESFAHNANTISDGHAARALWSIA